MFTLLILIATLAAEPAPSPGDASAREGKHLREIRQVTFGFSKAGDGPSKYHWAKVISGPPAKACSFSARQDP